MNPSRSARSGFAVFPLAVMLLAIVAACASPAPTEPASPAPIASPAAIASPTAGASASATAASPSTAAAASPTPSSSSDALIKAFLGQIGDPTFAARSTVSGTVTVGPASYPLSGTTEQSGGDNRQTITIAFPSRPQTTETLKIAGTAYERMGGLWFEKAPTKGASNQDLSSFLQAITTLSDAGIETKGGRTLHHLELPSGTTVPPSMFGLDDPSRTDGQVRLDFYAEGDGTPAVVAVHASWTQRGATASTPVAMEMEMAFADVGVARTIERPDQVWRTATSKVYRYSMAYPTDWDVTLARKSSKPDVYLSGDSSAVAITSVPAGGYTLNALTAGVIHESKATVKSFVLASNTATTIGGLRARRLETRGTYASGRAWDITYLVVRHGKLYMVDFGSTTRLTAADRALAAAMVGSITFR